MSSENVRQLSTESKPKSAIDLSVQSQLAQSGEDVKEVEPSLFLQLLFGEGGISVFVIFPLVVLYYFKMALGN
jgi:hypothetical protein